MTRTTDTDLRARRDAFIRAEHFRYRPFAAGGPADGEFALPARASLAVEATETSLVARMIADFTTFCAACMGVTLVPAAGEAVVRLRLTGNTPLDVLDPAGEAFTLEVTPSGVLLEAHHERGLLHGTHYLEHLLADRGGPYLPHGQWERAPVFTPRLSRGFFASLSDDYLSLMSHYGVNGMLHGGNLLKYCRSSVMPELNDPKAERRLTELNAHIERLFRHGIDTYLYVCTNPLPVDHPAFLANPARRGAPLRVFDDMAAQHVLCSSNEEVLAYYDEAVEGLFRAAPAAAGAVVIVGGEGFMHCYTRPYGDFAGYSSCPRCRETAPSAPVAQLVNRVAAAVKRTGQRKPIFAWPYSAFTWSGADRAQLEWIAGLSEDVQVLSNFDTNSPDEPGGAGVVFYDYNIKSIGPSAVFRAQAAKVAEMGKRIYAKTESNATPTVHCLPYIPVHFRWHERFREMARIGVAGYMGQWGFYGMNATLPEEMQYHAVWNPDEEAEELLARAAARDFGVSRATSAQVVEAWRLLSEAWDDFPFSAMTSGEREFYMRGPVHYGPAHPLIFNTQNRYKLSAKFFGISGDLRDLATPAEVEKLLRDAKPRYVSELLLTLPYGVERYLELASRCRARWARGVAALKAALGKQPSDRARMELDVCELMEIHLTTLEHVVRFYEARERLWRTPVDIPAFRRIIDELSAMLSAEIANAERSLPILDRDFRVKVYDAGMVREKIRQCRYVLEDELPIFSVTVRFHVWNDFP